MRQIHPVRGPDLTVFPKVSAGPLPDAVADLARLYSDRASAATADHYWLRANVVTSADGAAALDGRSGGLSGPADRMVFTVLRSLADVILVGAGTARTEHYKPVTAARIWTGLRPPGAALPVIAVVTASLSLGSCAGLLTGEQPPIIITTADAAAADAASGRPLAAQAQILVAGQQRIDVRQAVIALAGLGHRQILVEGGPHLLGQLVNADLVDEFCITISPLLADGPAGRVVGPVVPGHGAAGHAATNLILAHVLADNGFLLCRYLREISPAPREE